MSVHAPNKALNGSENNSSANNGSENNSSVTSPLLAPNTSFFALFVVQFLGAFNDNLFKNALVMLIAFKLTTDNSGLLITLAAGLFILPFFLFSSLAGQLADRYPKAWLLQKTKLAEVLIMSLGAWALWMQHLEGLLIVLFLMGAQSAFFGPLKYAILPEIVPNQQLLQGNGLISGSTFIAILLGTILGGLGVLLEHGLALMAGTVMLVALLGYGASVRLLVLSRRGAKLPVQNSSVAVELNIIKSTWTMVALSRTHRQAFWAVLAISWFWFMGAVLLSQFPTLVKTHLMSDDGVVVAFLTLFSVGVAVGSGLMGWLLKGQVTLKWHAFLLMGLSVALALLVAVIAGYVPTTQNGLYPFSQFIQQGYNTLSLVLLFVLAVFGGAYIVPLYTLLQIKTPQQHRARMMATNNILNALFMVVASVLLMVGFANEVSLLTQLLIMAALNLAVAVGFVKMKHSTE